jgi:glycine/D-amino acid oxidase-like deaminating enzyme
LAATADVVICGAGIAGISAAYHLSHKHGVNDIVLIDELPPLSLTSDKSTECYRNWWPGPGGGMVQLMNRSIDLLETWATESRNRFHLNRRGYLFATADLERARGFEESGREISGLGAGPLRVHLGEAGDPVYQPAPPEGFRDLPDGADLLLDPDLIQRHFPYLTREAVAVLHTRRCGWFSAQQLGRFLLDMALGKGARLLEGSVTGVKLRSGQVSHVEVETDGGRSLLATERFVIAAGPRVREVASLLDVDLPIFCELHSKISFQDRLGAMPRHAPLLIWSDPQRIPWKPPERKQLKLDPELGWLLEEFPEGVHARPDGPDTSPIVLLLWTYDTDPVEPVFPPDHDDQLYPELALRGFSRMVPRMAEYWERLPKPFVDGGYYAKTAENRPLIGPLPPAGAHLIGALSGFGLMAAPAAGELLADHVVGAELPAFESWFRLSRYEDPHYQELLTDWGSSGQL